MRAATEQRLDNLRRRRSQLDAEVSRLEATLKTAKRKADTRRKILIGAVVMQEMEKRQELYQWVEGLLKQRLTRPGDRALFGLQDLGGKAPD